MKIKRFAAVAASLTLFLGLTTLMTSCSEAQSEQGNTNDDTMITQAPDTALSVYIESESGLAIRGTDPVAYFTQGEAVEGTAEFEHEWNNATWRFSSQEHLDLFAQNPEQYAPQYGGYCAKAVSEGNLASIDPQSWKIVDDKLYLNYSPQVQDQWSQDVPGNITLADENWPDVLVDNKVHENKI